MKVLYVYYEPQPSGQTAHVLSLVRGLDARRFEVTVVLPQSLGASVGAFEQAGAKVVPLPLRKVAWSPGAMVALVRLIRSERFDIVHVHSQEAGLIGRLLAWLSGARAVLYTPQTIDIRRTRWHWLVRRIERLLAAVTDRIVSVADCDRVRLIRWGIPPHKVVTIPNGIDLAPFSGPVDRDALRAELGLDGRRPVVMQVGRLSAQKDPLAFVEGASLVVRQWPQAQFVLVGDGPLRTEVAGRIRELSLGGQVVIAGWRENAPRLMAAADVVSLTSRWEGAPYALLEAMAWSLPVVATAVNGCPEIVVEGVTGFLVPPGDAAAWAAMVQALLGDTGLAASMGRQGRKRIDEKFTLERMTKQVAGLYLEVAR